MWQGWADVLMDSHGNDCMLLDHFKDTLRSAQNLCILAHLGKIQNLCSWAHLGKTWLEHEWSLKKAHTHEAHTKYCCFLIFFYNGFQ